VIVVKVGGRTLKNIEAIARDLINHQPFVLIHGGGDFVTQYSKKMGVEPKIVTSPSGVRSRYTDEDELEVFVMVMAGKVNKEIVSKLLDLGIKAVGISGVDGPTLIAERKKRIVVLEKGRRRVIPGGFTGKIREVNTSLLNSLLAEGYNVVLAPLARGMEGEMLNVDGDQAASEVAKALRPRYLVLLSDVDGVIYEGQLIKKLSWNESIQLAERIGPGMNRKLLMAGRVAEQQIHVVIASGLVEEPIKRALAGGGTHITALESS